MTKENTDYLYNWGDSVDNFFYWVANACGHEEDSRVYSTLHKLIKTQKDLDEFIEVFDGNLDLNASTGRFAIDRTQPLV